MGVYSFQPLFTKGGFAVHNCSFPVPSRSRSHRHRSVGPRYRKSWGAGLKILTGLKLMTSWTKACLPNDSANGWWYWWLGIGGFLPPIPKSKACLQISREQYMCTFPSTTTCQTGGFAKPSKFVPGCSALTRVAIWGLKNGKMFVSEGKRL